MKRIFTFFIVCFCFFSTKAEVGDTLYHEGFEVEDIKSTVFQYNPEWIAWNEAYVVDSVKFNGTKSLLVPAGKGTWGEFIGKVPTWTFKPNKYYKIKMVVKMTEARSIDVTRLSEGSVLTYNGVEMDAFDNNGEWVCNLNNEETAISYTGKWQQVTMYLKFGTGTAAANGPSFGFGWGGKSNLFIDDISVVETNEAEMDAEKEWIKEVTPPDNRVTLYFEDFEKANLSETVFQYNPDWSSWNGAFIVDSVKYKGQKSLLVPPGKGTWGEFIGKVPTWVFKPTEFYKLIFIVKQKEARSIDITRLSEGSVLYHNGVQVDAWDNNGEWVCNLNNAETGIKYTGEWQQIVAYLQFGTGTPAANGPSFGLGWGGESNLFLDEIRVLESSEEEMKAEKAWVTPLTSTGIANTKLDTSAKLYPNPAQGDVFISAKFEVSQVKVYSLSGSLIKSFDVRSQKSFSTNGIASGLYTIILQGENSKSTTKLIVK